MTQAVPKERRIEAMVRARLYGRKAGAEWCGVTPQAIAVWERDEALAREADEGARALRGAWLEELEASCAEAARAVTELTRRYAEAARRVLDDPASVDSEGQPLNEVARLRLIAGVLDDLRSVAAGAAETLTHYTAVCGAPTKASTPPGVRRVA